MIKLRKYRSEFIKKSRNWFDISNEFNRETCIDPLTRFLYLWISFNTLYTLYSNTGRGRQEDKIKETINKLYEKEQFNPEEFINANEKDIENLLNWNVVNLRDLYSSKYHNENDAKTYKNKDSDVEKIIYIFSIIYRIRNNFIHGSKGLANRKKEDLKLIRIANNILYNFLEPILKQGC